MANEHIKIDFKILNRMLQVIFQCFVKRGMGIGYVWIGIILLLQRIALFQVHDDYLVHYIVTDHDG